MNSVSGYTPRIPTLIGAWVKTERKRNAARGPDHFRSEGELRAEGERAIEAHDADIREPLLARIAVLEGQVARVEWMLTDAWNGSAPLTFSEVKQALAIPAEGVEAREILTAYEADERNRFRGMRHFERITYLDSYRVSLGEGGNWEFSEDQLGALLEIDEAITNQEEASS